MALGFGVGALRVAQLALEALVDDPLLQIFRNPTHVAMAIHRIEERGEGLAVLEAHPTAVAQLEGAHQLPVECVLHPVQLLVRVVAQAIGWLESDLRKLV